MKHVDTFVIIGCCLMLLVYTAYMLGRSHGLLEAPTKVVPSTYPASKTQAMQWGKYFVARGQR